MKKCSLFITILFFAFNLNGQQEMSNGVIIEVQTKDGNTIVGELVNMGEKEISLETKSLGLITLKRSNIMKMTTIDDLKESSLYTSEIDGLGISMDYHNSTHYLVNPSAFSLKKGQKYYENIAVFFNSFSFGVTDNFDISVGGEIASLLFGSQFPILYISPKFSIPLSENKHGFSVGGTIFTSPTNDFTTIGVLQGAVTIGDRNNNISLGTGFGFSFSDGIEDSVLPFYLSFMKRVGPKFSIVSDNFIISYDGFSDRFGLFSFAGRFHFKRPGTALNVGLWRPTADIGDAIAIPFISATMALGK